MQGVGHALFVDDPARFDGAGGRLHPPPRLAVRRRAALATLAPLFLVSLATVGFEIALTRYFAVAKWSEYGYWVISIVLAGFALSGVVMALARDAFARHGRALLSALPVALILAAAGGLPPGHRSTRSTRCNCRTRRPSHAAALEHRRLLCRRCCRSSSSPGSTSA